MVLCAVGCGLNMRDHYSTLKPSLVSGQMKVALQTIEAKKESFYGRKNRLLFYMDKAMVLHLDGDYEASNHVLEEAKKAAQELWTESVSSHAAALISNDNTLPYPGEDFELVMLHVLAALNHMGKKDYSGAQVEARQVTSRLLALNDRYSEHQNVYRDDAFARWLSAKLAVSSGPTAQDWNEAWIDIKQALEVYTQEYAVRYHTPLPALVLEDAALVLQSLGPDFASEWETFKAKYGAVSVNPVDVKNKGEFLFIHQNGEAPQKRDRFWTTFVGNGDIIRIAYPEFVRRPRRIHHAVVSVAGQKTIPQLMENIEAVGIQNLQDHMARIKAKAVARQVAKYMAGAALQSAGEHKKGSGGAAMQLAGALWNVTSAVTEEADKRSWVTLPAEMAVGRVWLEPGEHTVRVDYMSVDGSVIDATQFSVVVKAGETTFVSRRTFL